MPAHESAAASPAPALPPHAVMEAAADWFALLISDDATVADRRNWQRWLDASEDHRRAWQCVEKVSQRVLAPLRETSNPRLTADNLHAANQRVRQRRRLLAVLATLAGSGLFALSGRRPGEIGRALLAWTTDVHSAVGEIRDVTLADGSNVWLNTDSAFGEDFQPALRRLRLDRGEIFVDTARDPQRPFVVDTAQGRLRALGTRFTVGLDAGETCLAVYHGAVEIRAAETGARVVIPAGRQTRFTSAAISLDEAADPAREAWIRGNLVAIDLPLADVIAELGRYTHAHLGVAPEVAQRRVFGTFPLRDIDGALALLAQAAQLRVRRPLPWWTTLEAA